MSNLSENTVEEIPGSAFNFATRVRVINEVLAALTTIKVVAGQLLTIGDLPEAIGEGLEEIVEESEAGLQFVSFHALNHDESMTEDLLAEFRHDLVNKICTINENCKELLQSDPKGPVEFLNAVREIKSVENDLRARLSERMTSNPEIVATDDSLRNFAKREHVAGKILVVDDEDRVRLDLVSRLQKQGHDVLQATSHHEAIAVLDEHHDTDLVLLDVQIKDGTGLNVLAFMKADYSLRSIPVVMISANSKTDSVVQCIHNGADDYLTKPLDTDLLYARVGACLSKRLAENRQRELGQQIKVEKNRALDLLYEVFPYTVAEELRTGNRVQPRGCENVAVLFADLVGFTSYSAGRSPEHVVAQLHQLFSCFDDIVGEAGLEKIKTIGDCYMMTAGLTQRIENPVFEALQCAKQMLDTTTSVESRWQLRIGIHHGPVVAGMVGKRQYAFDVWGDTVNTASRVENASVVGSVCLSEPAWAQVYDRCRGRSIGVKKMKGKEAMELFQFESFR